MSFFNNPTYDVDHLSFAKHPLLETPFHEALRVVNNAKRAAYYKADRNRSLNQDDQGEEVLSARLKLANMAYTILLDYEKLAGTEFYDEVLRKGSPKPKRLSFYQVCAWREFRQCILDEAWVHWEGRCIGKGVAAIVEYLLNVIRHSKGLELSFARTELKVYVDLLIHRYKLQHEERLRNASSCRRLAEKAIEDGDHWEAEYMEKETNRYIFGAQISFERMMRMQDLRGLGRV